MSREPPKIDGVPLFRLDVMPPGCGLEVELRPGLPPTEIRFRAFDGWAEGENHSRWSGWYPWREETIELTWDAFDWERGVG